MLHPVSDSVWLIKMVKSQGSSLEVQAFGLLEPFLPQIWISVGEWRLILGADAAASDRGSLVRGGCGIGSLRFHRNF